MNPKHRAKPLEIAAQRGEKGFSSVVAEAIERYLRGQSSYDEIRKKALRAGRTLDKKDAEQLRRRVAEIRGFWR